MAQKLCQLKKKGGGGGYNNLTVKVKTSSTSSSTAAVKVLISSGNNNIADVDFMYSKINTNSFLDAFSIRYISSQFVITVLSSSLKINGTTYTQNQTVSWMYSTTVDYSITDITY